MGVEIGERIRRYLLSLDNEVHKQAEFYVNRVDIFSNHWLEKIEIYLTVPPLCKFSFLPILKL